ncbi:MAG: undecaprenyldiphospho-muramoylpentapeptide beta-N-acetylglucosaminyltransferase [Gammaproteobacteria bacterium]|jgi:UDP-N-acetylglucosamine--N-acetylmuramyl-(pentapeptide) pyrophosphoryl-undecaprenol N-acetylglucosamine transferase|nr:undecaprenyldiphospho-muramoylpentapeptide beta-N-acetylglucosaminyltransferase [Gammaproteobacteria bacterium]MBK9469382.1 undecaprenyldiphospho-muramoylpentapeptide beta-N-acetylglucosaminyltransferase [Gammaproteobacteria bacterium]MBP6479985.1 undecaprenyldiphospho-muramoylpentapeptide beta-N-acetylglucosaminyltransferase [Pseudomonadales bacterium]MBP7908893.1 undecaprenyldiphospho-muramoylpentapeptide beta-N-acetylglucosaminyltransferase [Pseudomonadales bacterium]
MPERSPLVLITGGGTGGHVFPGLAAAAALTARGARVHWLGTHAGMESRLVPAAGIPISFLRVSGVRGKSRRQQLLAPLLLLVAIVHALLLVLKLRPACMLGTGGFVAGPGGIAAWLLRVPVVVHEQNAVAGTTNRLLARIAARILLGLPGPFAEHPRARLAGNPVRAAIAAIPVPAERLAGRAGPLRLLVIGGSQGARVLNETLPAALALLAAGERPEVWHQGGAREFEACRERYRERGVAARTAAFIDDMVAAYEWADVVVCRAGALTVSELAAAGLAAILVPLPTAIDDHQSMNARWLADAGAALAVAQAALTPEWLAGQLSRWSAARDELLLMATRARALAMPRAADTVAANCLEVAR